MNRKIFAAVFVSLCAIYAAVRFWGVYDACLWFDEIFSIHAAEMPWNQLFPFIGNDLIHPPFFYILLKFWMTAAGDSLMSVRSFSVIFSLSSIFPFYKLCRQLKLPDSGIAFAMVLFAVNGSLIKYAQEVRMYSVLLFLSLTSIWLFARYLNVGKGIWFLTAVNILLVHTQYFGWFVVGSEVMILLILQRVKIGQMMIMFALTIAASLPWTIFTLSRSSLASNAAQNLGWADRPGAIEVVSFVINLVEPLYFRMSNVDKLTVWQISIPILTIIITLFFFYFADAKRHSENDRNGLVFLSCMIVLPFAAAFFASWILPFSIWGSRHLIMVFAPFFILAGKSIGGLRSKRIAAAFGISIAILSAVAFLIKLNARQPAAIWCAWENFADSIPNDTEQKTLAVFEDLAAYQAWFAVRKRKDISVIKAEGARDVIEDTAYFLPRGFDGVTKIAVSALTGNQIYLAYRGKTADSFSAAEMLRSNGYRIILIKEFRSNGSTAFLVKAEK